MPWFSTKNEERLLATRIEELLSRAVNPDAAFTVDRLRTLTGAESLSSLTIAIQDLVSQGKLRTIVRVESPSNKGGVVDYPSTNDLPPEVVDWRTGERIKVTPKNVRILFAPPSRA